MITSVTFQSRTTTKKTLLSTSPPTPKKTHFSSFLRSSSLIVIFIRLIHIQMTTFPGETGLTLITGQLTAFDRQLKHCIGNATPGEFLLSTNPSVLLHILTSCDLKPQDLAKLEVTCSFFRKPAHLPPDYELALTELAAFDMCQKRAKIRSMTEEQRHLMKQTSGGSWKLLLRDLIAREREPQALMLAWNKLWEGQGDEDGDGYEDEDRYEYGYGYEDEDEYEEEEVVEGDEQEEELVEEEKEEVAEEEEMSEYTSTEEEVVEEQEDEDMSDDSY